MKQATPTVHTRPHDTHQDAHLQACGGRHPDRRCAHACTPELHRVQQERMGEQILGVCFVCFVLAGRCSPAQSARCVHEPCRFALRVRCWATWACPALPHAHVVHHGGHASHTDLPVLASWPSCVCRQLEQKSAWAGGCSSNRPTTTRNARSSTTLVRALVGYGWHRWYGWYAWYGTLAREWRCSEQPKARRFYVYPAQLIRHRLQITE